MSEWLANFTWLTPLCVGARGFNDQYGLPRLALVRWRARLLRPKTSTAVLIVLDLHIPDGDIVGGYSMCSGVDEFRRTRRFSLAVKSSVNPAAIWMLNKCTAGMELSYKFGGKVFLDDSDRNMKARSYVLVAGGVGINPIYSILQTAITLTDKPVCLLYSAASYHELIFWKDIDRLAQCCHNFSAKCFLTKDCSERDKLDESNINVTFTYGRRLDKEDLAHALRPLDLTSLSVYLCGPNEMMESVSNILQQRSVPSSNIHYETWW